ncbi:hypothetical protein D6D23_07145 [Aureobasidium pullulans]|nr:hypothetical protein D6D23_07145 [Aureobasidium pullulans]
MATPPNFFVEPPYILSIPTLVDVEHCIIGLALRFVLLGRINAARDFLDLYYSRPVLQNLEATGPRALTPYWHATEYPTNLPAFMKTDDYFKDYMDSKTQEGVQWPVYVPQEKRTEDEAGIDAILSPEHSRPGYYTTLAPRSALEIAIDLAEKRGNDPINDEKVQEILGVIVKRFSPHYTWRDLNLIDSPRCAPLFISGALARAFNATDQQLDSHAKKLLEASQQRYWQGFTPSVPYTIPELLQECNNASVDKSDDHWVEMDEEKSMSLFKPPATEEDISNLEKRLDTTLPEDFKAFLRVSNGFGGIWNGHFPGPPLHSTEKIDCINPGEYELTFDQLTLPYEVMTHKNIETGKEDFIGSPVFEKVIEIASYDIDSVWLIPPPLMRKMRDHYKKLYNMADDHGKRTIERSVDDFAGSWEQWEKLEWGCVYWAAGGSAQLDSFKSFKAWLADSAYCAKTRGGDI